MSGATIGVIFDCAWGIAGVTALRSPWQTRAIASSIAISIVLIVALSCPRKQPASGVFRGDIYGMAVAFEVLGIFATIWLLKHFRSSAIHCACDRIRRRVAFSWLVESH